MPLYEFKCNDCDCEFEELIRSFSTHRSIITMDEKGIEIEGSPNTKTNLVFCPNCGGDNFERIYPLIGNTPSKWGENGARESLA